MSLVRVKITKPTPGFVQGEVVEVTRNIAHGLRERGVANYTTEEVGVPTYQHTSMHVSKTTKRGRNRFR